jgi:hypothetical protein
MLAPAAMLGAAAGAAEVDPGDPPSGPPTDVSTYNSGDEENPETGIQWTNGDATANTQIGQSTSASVDPTSVYASVAPGVTSYETGIASSNYWYARHAKNGQFSAWVLGGQGFA